MMHSTDSLKQHVWTTLRLKSSKTFPDQWRRACAVIAQASEFKITRQRWLRPVLCSAARSCLALRPSGLQPTRLLCPWILQARRLGCRFFLQGIFPTQGSHHCLLHWQLNSLQLSHLGTPPCFYHPLNVRWVTHMNETTFFSLFSLSYLILELSF